MLAGKLVIGTARPNPLRTGHVHEADSLASDRSNGLREFVDRDHLLRSDVDRTRDTGAHDAQGSFDAFVDVEERPRLAAVAPHLDLPAVSGLGDLPAEGSGGLLAPSAPSTLRAEHVVIACDPHHDTVVARGGKVEPLGEELFKSVIRVRVGGVDAILARDRMVRIGLVSARVNARGGREENAADVALLGCLDDIEVDPHGVTEDIGIVLSGENEACSAHVGGELIHLVESPVEYGLAGGQVAEIRDHELVCVAFGVLRPLDVDASDEVSVSPEASNQVGADESTCAANQGGFGHGAFVLAFRSGPDY